LSSQLGPLSSPTLCLAPSFVFPDDLKPLSGSKKFLITVVPPLRFPLLLLSAFLSLQTEGLFPFFGGHCVFRDPVEDPLSITCLHLSLVPPFVCCWTPSYPFFEPRPLDLVFGLSDGLARMSCSDWYASFFPFSVTLEHTTSNRCHFLRAYVALVDSRVDLMTAIPPLFLFFSAGFSGARFFGAISPIVPPWLLGVRPTPLLRPPTFRFSCTYRLPPCLPG